LFLAPQLPSLLAQTGPEEYLKEAGLMVLVLYLAVLPQPVVAVVAGELQTV
jgi:hypothetical protein